MNGAVLAMPRQQSIPRSLPIDAETREAEGALTVEACAMYRAALEAMLHADALAVRTLRAEHSHQRDNLTARMQAVRLQVALAVEDVYRLAASAPGSKFSNVIEAQEALRQAAGALLMPDKGAQQ